LERKGETFCPCLKYQAQAQAQETSREILSDQRPEKKRKLHFALVQILAKPETRVFRKGEIVCSCLDYLQLRDQKIK
jgi:hypothetical protein